MLSDRQEAGSVGRARTAQRLTSPRARRARCLMREGRSLMVLDMAFCVTWAYWLQLMGFQYRGSVASCESHHERTSCPRSE